MDPNNDVHAKRLRKTVVCVGFFVLARLHRNSTLSSPNQPQVCLF